nr:PD-(D/E)XK nuclease family protein [Anaerolineae bacterium]
MEITCMAGKGTMASEACLQCAGQGENRCGYTYSLLRYVYLHQQARTGIHVTDLTGCLRKAFYSRTEPLAFMPHERLIVSLGTATHAVLEGADDRVQTEIPVQAFGVVGTVDAYQPDDRHIVDFKSTRWLVPSKLPYGSHAKQVNYYAAMMREMGYEVEQLSIQYIDLSGPTKCRKCKQIVTPDEEGTLICPVCGNEIANAHLGAVQYFIDVEDQNAVREELIQRKDALSFAYAMQSPPDAETGFLCWYCDHASRCPEGQEWINSH